MTTNFPNPVDGDVQALIGLCKIEIKRWKAASEANPNMSYMLTLMETSLASLTAVPLASTEKHEISNMRATGLYLRAWPVGREENERDGFNIHLYTAPPAHLLRPVELSQSFYGVVQDGKSVMLAADDGQWLNKTAVIEALRQQGYEVKS
ncbi:hypothetical protein [Pantoea sp. V106_11]|uniref:hypothetical protein n=1 Tax=Pantoea sp. V106_11 TaxID=3044234 RepID=UPI00249F8E8E|nr:hypothetical protein [Pantoea sp. V106_11]MDI3415680.1 hypothetical protein [Pantoea sp. V106_11]